jgi:hypothetical protein
MKAALDAATGQQSTFADETEGALEPQFALGLLEQGWME